MSQSVKNTLTTRIKYPVDWQLWSCLHLCETGLHATFWVSNGYILNVYTFSCGRYGYSLWPMWLWTIWSVADMVQTPSAYCTLNTQYRIVNILSGQKPAYTRNVFHRIIRIMMKSRGNVLYINVVRTYVGGQLYALIQVRIPSNVTM